MFIQHTPTWSISTRYTITNIKYFHIEISSALSMGRNTSITTDESDDNTFKSIVPKPPTSIEHNEACEVCEREGNLVCCNTCSLVFHLCCLRPKLATVPKGPWSCPYCIVIVRASSTCIVS